MQNLSLDRIHLALGTIVFFIGNKNLSGVKDKEEKQDISEISDQIQKNSN
jgi:GTP cyclohydrolase III